jgi:ABC-2 type transport system ATP-binding protein
LRFHGRLRGLPLARCDEVLAEVGLADHASTASNKLPAALARRLAFGRAILHHPALLILMEPFSGCEAASCALISRLVSQYAGQGAAVLILAREGAGMANLCGSVYALDAGHLSRVELPRAGQDLKGVGDSTGMSMPFKVPARQEGQVTLINPADILYASAEEDQTHLYTSQGEVPSHLTMGELEERLARNGFFRAHRGYLVNLQRVKAIIPYTRDSYTLILDDAANTEIPLSKSAAKELRELLGY